MNEEAKLQSQCQKLLTKLEILWRHDISAKTRHGVKGWPDLIFFRGGKSYACELKAEGKKPRSEQSEMLMRLSVDGGFITGWVDSYEKFEAWLHELHILK